MHILMRIGRDLYLVVNSNNVGFVNQAFEPLAREGGVPGGISTSLGGRRCRIGTIGEKSITGIGKIGIE